MAADREYRNLFRNHILIASFISAILLIVSPIGLSIGADASELPQGKDATIKLYMKKYEKNDVVHYSGSSLAKTVKVSSEEYFKGSPYVCTPSGFGRTSHCRTRSLF
ncbi:hypothetical protein BSK43_016645 [Rhizobium sp. P44RR-XXIV]|nr:hypothetical protein BSK43_016645 [Rhizobium sp. P44RR-XXIV]